MPKRKRGITGNAQRKRRALAQRLRRAKKKEEEMYRRLIMQARRQQNVRAQEIEEETRKRLSRSESTEASSSTLGVMFIVNERIESPIKSESTEASSSTLGVMFNVNERIEPTIKSESTEASSPTLGVMFNVNERIEPTIKSESTEASSPTLGVMFNVNERIESPIKIKNENESAITSVETQERQQDNPLITPILIKEENMLEENAEPDLISLSANAHQNCLITPSKTREMGFGNSSVSIIKTEEENSLISTIKTHERIEDNSRKMKDKVITSIQTGEENMDTSTHQNSLIIPNKTGKIVHGNSSITSTEAVEENSKVITSIQTEEEKVADEQAKDLITRFSRMYHNMLKVFFENKGDCHLMKCLRTFLQENEELNSAETIVRFFESCRKYHSDPSDLILHSA